MDGVTRPYQRVAAANAEQARATVPTRERSSARRGATGAATHPVAGKYASL
jgi:hypothetical protein